MRYLFKDRVRAKIFCLVTKSCPALLQPPWTSACQAPLSTGILQAKILEWVVISFSRRPSQTTG